MKTAHKSGAAFFALVVLILLFLVPSVRSQDHTPHIISYQGVLTLGGTTVDGPYRLTFRLYTDSVGNDPLWLGSYNVDIHSGVFSVLLGYGDDPLPPINELDRPLWLGVRVGNEPEMKPLTPFTAALYALNVADASITSSKIVDGAVTASKLSVDYIRAISVQGKDLTGSAATINLKGAGGIDVNYDPVTRAVVIGTQTGNLVSTPEPLLGNTDNYRIDAYANYIRLANESSGTILLTGIDHTGVSYGRMITIANIGDKPIVLKHRYGSSAIGNQFDLPGNSDVILGSHGAATFIYDRLLNCWTFVAGS